MTEMPREGDADEVTLNDCSWDRAAGHDVGSMARRIGCRADDPVQAFQSLPIPVGVLSV